MLFDNTIIFQEIYKAMTTAPDILIQNPDFLGELLEKVLPICDSEKDDQEVTTKINELYQKYPEIRTSIKNQFRKHLDHAQPQKNSDYSTVTNEDQTTEKLKKLEASLKKRIENNQKKS